MKTSNLQKVCWPSGTSESYRGRPLMVALGYGHNYMENSRNAYKHARKAVNGYSCDHAERCYM